MEKKWAQLEKSTKHGSVPHQQQLPSQIYEMMRYIFKLYYFSFKCLDAVERQLIITTKNTDFIFALFHTTVLCSPLQ